MLGRIMSKPWMWYNGFCCWLVIDNDDEDGDKQDADDDNDNDDRIK